MPDASDDLEGALDRAVARLSRPGAPKEARALLVDLRRLLGVVRNWQTIAPTDAARAHMQERVDALLESVERTLPTDPAPPHPRPAPAPEPPRRDTAGRPRAGSPSEAAMSAAVKAPATLIVDEEATRAAPIDAAARAAVQASRDLAAARARADDAGRAQVQQAAIVSAIDVSDVLPPEVSFALEDVSGPTLDDASRPTAPAPAPAHQDGGTLEPVRSRTLPDLDISGIAQLIEEPPGFALDDPLESPRGARLRAHREGIDPGRGRVPDPVRGRPPSDPVRGRPPSDPVRGRPPSDPVRGTSGSDPSLKAQSSSTPPAGRRRPDNVDRPSVLDGGARQTRYSQLFDDPESSDGVVYPGLEDPGRKSTPGAQRATPRPSPAPAQRVDKTAIAVTPLPPPEVLDERLVLLTEPYSARAEAYRTLRRKLSGAGAPRTIAITSPEQGEGKTTCAANLALAFRETSNEKILLVEANLRAPALAKLFGFEPPVCFAGQMAKNRETGRMSWTVAEQFEPLHVLAVDPSSKTSPMIDPVAFANALEQLVEAGYDHIIVDTPPALGGSDVNVVADVVDGVVIVAWLKKSRKSLVKKAIDQLKPATILGVVTLEG